MPGSPGADKLTGEPAVLGFVIGLRICNRCTQKRSQFSPGHAGIWNSPNGCAWYRLCP